MKTITKKQVIDAFIEGLGQPAGAEVGHALSVYTFPKSKSALKRVIEQENAWKRLASIAFNIEIEEVRMWGEAINYIIQDTEAGNIIESFKTLEEAEKQLQDYEAEDKYDGTFEPDFYEIVEV